MEILSPGATILTVTENGYGKRTPLEDYRLQKRGGQGIITIRTSERNGEVVGVAQVVDDDEVMLITDGGKVLRCRVSGISTMGRATQGVRVMDLGRGREARGSMARLAESARADARRARVGSNIRSRPCGSTGWRSTATLRRLSGLRTAPNPRSTPVDDEANQSKNCVRARKVIPGGVNSPVRAFGSVGGVAPVHRARQGLRGSGTPTATRTSTTSAPGARWCSGTPNPARAAGGARGGGARHQLRRADASSKCELAEAIRRALPSGRAGAHRVARAPRRR